MNSSSFVARTHSYLRWQGARRIAEIGRIQQFARANCDDLDSASGRDGDTKSSFSSIDALADLIGVKDRGLIRAQCFVGGAWTDAERDGDTLPVQPANWRRSSGAEDGPSGDGDPSRTPPAPCPSGPRSPHQSARPFSTAGTPSSWTTATTSRASWSPSRANRWPRPKAKGHAASSWSGSPRKPERVRRGHPDARSRHQGVRHASARLRRHHTLELSLAMITRKGRRRCRLRRRREGPRGDVAERVCARCPRERAGSRPGRSSSSPAIHEAIGDALDLE